MSDFLAPIHFIMYDKILFLNDFVVNYIDLAEENNIVLEKLKDLGEIEKAPLDKIIDKDNIHSWLQDKVEIVEKRFAYVISEILKKDDNLIIEILKFAYRKGRSENFVGSAEEAFKLIISRFLDGMPCDRSIAIVESREEYVKFIIEVDNHSKYWTYGEPASIYWEIRNKYIKGLLSSSRYHLSNDENEYEIRG